MTDISMLIYFLLFLLVCAIAAWERTRIQEVIRLLVLVVTGGVLITPLSTFLSGVLQRVRVWILSSLTNHEPPEVRPSTETPTPAAPTTPATPPARLYGRQGYHVGRIAMALLLTACNTVFLTFALAFGWATLSAMGLIPEAGDPPMALTRVATYALIASAVVSGALLLEVAGWTRFLPPFGIKARRAVGWSAASMLVLAIGVEMAMGGWRASAAETGTPVVVAAAPEATESTASSGPMVEADASFFSPSGAGDSAGSSAGVEASPAKMFVATALPALVLASAVVSAPGTLWLMEYLLIFAAAIAVMPLAIVNNLLLPIWNNVVGHLIAGLNAVVDFVANLGDRMLTARWRPDPADTASRQPAGSAPATEHTHEEHTPGADGDGETPPPDTHQPTLESPRPPAGTSPEIDRNWFFMGDESPKAGGRS